MIKPFPKFIAACGYCHEYSERKAYKVCYICECPEMTYVSLESLRAFLEKANDRMQDAITESSFEFQERYNEGRLAMVTEILQWLQPEKEE